MKIELHTNTEDLEELLKRLNSSFSRFYKNKKISINKELISTNAPFGDLYNVNTEAIVITILSSSVLTAVINGIFGILKEYISSKKDKKANNTIDENKVHKFNIVINQNKYEINIDNCDQVYNSAINDIEKFSND